MTELFILRVASKRFLYKFQPRMGLLTSYDNSAEALATAAAAKNLDECSVLKPAETYFYGY